MFPFWHIYAFVWKIMFLLQHKTIDSVLARGEKLDSLVEKSSDLSAASQVHLLDFIHYRHSFASIVYL